MSLVEVKGRQQGEVAKREALLLTTIVSYSAYAAASMCTLYVYGTNQQVVLYFSCLGRQCVMSIWTVLISMYTETPKVTFRLSL